MKRKSNRHGIENLRPYKKGQSGNPLGAKLHHPELRKLKNLTREEMKEIGSLVVKGSISELKAIAKDPKATALQCMMAAVAVRVISKGDAHALDVLLNRLVGKVKDEVEWVGNKQNPVVVVLPAKDPDPHELETPRIELPDVGRTED